MPGGGWRRRGRAVLPLILLGLCSTGKVYAGTNTPHEPRIGVYVDVDTAPTMIHERSDPVLAQAGSGEKRLGGLAFLDLSMQAEYDVTLVTYSSGEALFWLSGIHLTLAYRNPQVYIAGRYPKGSCEYRSVQDHEDAHVARDREVVKTFAEKMESAIRSADWPTYANPRHVSTMEEGKAETGARLEALLQPLYEEMKERRREVRLALDSPGVSSGTTQRCNPR